LRFLTRITLFTACLILLSGVATAGVINGSVWYDQNCDGIRNTSEPGFDGVRVELYKQQASGQWVPQQPYYTTTDANGYYTFGDGHVGNYTVKFIAPAGYFFSPMGEDSDASTDSGNYGFVNYKNLPHCNYDVVWDAGLCKKICKEPLTQGYWKNHPDAWVNDPLTTMDPFTLKIGDKTYNGKDSLINDVLKQPVKNDARMILAYQLIAARLNVENGACPKTADLNELMNIIENAEEWLAGQKNKVSPSASPEAIAWAETLDQFNNGKY
jgi:hypothetical protein